MIHFMVTLPKIDQILFPSGCTEVGKYSILSLHPWNLAKGQCSNTYMAEHIYSAQKHADY